MLQPRGCCSTSLGANLKISVLLEKLRKCCFVVHPSGRSLDQRILVAESHALCCLKFACSSAA